jgi:hypothetical protein
MNNIYEGTEQELENFKLDLNARMESIVGHLITVAKTSPDDVRKCIFDTGLRELEVVESMIAKRNADFEEWIHARTTESVNN